MKMKKIIFALTLLFLAALPVRAGSGEEITRAKNLLRKSAVLVDAKILEEAHSLLQGMDSTGSLAPYRTYYLALSEYRFLEFSLRKEYKEYYDTYIGKAEFHVKEAVGQKGWESEAKALLANILMMKIAHNWSEAMSLVPVYQKLLKEAAAADSSNPRVPYLSAMMKYNTPEMFGGSKEEALKLFLKANMLFDAKEETDAMAPDWGRLESLIWTGQAYAALGNKETARFYYEKVLGEEPEYRWVKYVLLPRLEAKEESKQ